MAERGVHDLGGLDAGKVDLEPHEPTMTERRIDAMMMLLRAKPRSFWVTDENRRTIESLTPEFYSGARYYEKWVTAMRSLLLEKGILTEAEIDAKLAEVRKRFGRAD
ncbi:MAG: nitrile hydratase subunit beta [Hyphomicrobiaceae bacterium]|nr:nitrile hydratase subunit beta [Hyphomicrobiaceae bacterium]